MKETTKIIGLFTLIAALIAIIYFAIKYMKRSEEETDIDDTVDPKTQEHMQEVTQTTTQNEFSDLSLPRGYRNNNPLNIRITKDKWQGKITPNTDGQYEQFENMGYGFRAALKLLGNYIKKEHNTVRKIVTRWAPPSENKTTAYINHVAEMTQYDPDQVLTADKTTLCNLAYAMATHENGYAPQMSDIEAGYAIL